MTVHLRELIAHLDRTLEVGLFRDYGTNGLQVEGALEVDRVVTGVSANQALLDRALELQADLVVVHHGLLWGGGVSKIDGVLARRLKTLLVNDLSLAAYHLPLDKHATLGNNAGLCDALGLVGDRRAFGDVRGQALGLAIDLATPQPLPRLLETIASQVSRGAPPFVFAHGPATVRRVGVCSGAASDLLEAAVSAGCDVYVTGELAERAQELARELQITLVAAGHHATEVFGPQRLAAHIQATFGVHAEFVDVPGKL